METGTPDADASRPARPASPLRPARGVRRLARAGALAAIGLLVGGAAVGLLAEGARDWSGAVAAFDAYLMRVARFTLLQAALSTVLSVGTAVLVARALSRHPSFRGRAVLLRLFALPLALPAIVAALGILALLGRAGYLAAIVDMAGGGQWPGIYGLSGILVAHVFFNMPLAARLLLEALDTVPADQWRLASQLGMGAGPAFRLVEWPALRAALPGVAGLVFMLCVTSFTVVLTLGGGPAATTLEVAIYQSLRFDFDPARAVALTLLQVGLTLAALVALQRLGADMAAEAALSVSPRRHLVPGRRETVANAFVLAAAAAFVLLPMVAIVGAGIEADLPRLAGEPGVRRAAATSLALALGSGLLAVALALSLVAGRSRSGFRPAAARGPGDTAASLVLVVPPVVIGAGWFMLLRQTADIFAIAPAMVVAVNAVMAMPFAVRAISPAYLAGVERHDRLCAALGISGVSRWRLVDWPALRRPLATGLAFAMALSLGDLGVIALFGSDGVETLPYLLLARMGSYRTDDAAGIALLLGALCLGLMHVADRLGRETSR